MKYSCGGYHNMALFTKMVQENEEKGNKLDGKQSNINLDIFRNNLNIVKLSSTLKKDIPPL